MIYYNFLNPSIEDFLVQHFKESPEEYLVLLKSAVFLRQFNERIKTNDKAEDKKVPLIGKSSYSLLFKTFHDRISFLDTEGATQTLDVIVILLRLFKWKEIALEVVEYMDNFDLGYLSWTDRDNLIEILEYLATNNLLSYFQFSIQDVLLKLSSNMPSYYQIEKFSNFISKFDVYKEIIEEAKVKEVDFFNKIKSNIELSWNRHLYEFISKTYNINNVGTEDEIIKLVIKRKEYGQKLNQSIALGKSSTIEEYNYDIAAQIETNVMNLSNNNEDINVLSNGTDFDDTPEAVNRLFNSKDSNKLPDLPF